jgi:hypothetical protein
MKKFLQKTSKWLVIGLLSISQFAFSQSIEELYVKMPDILNPTLSSQNRLELLEYHKAHQTDTTLNRYGNQVMLLVMDTLNERLVVRNTPNSTFEMKVNYLKDSIPYIGIIRTICAPVCQSTIEFYDTAWNVIPLQFTMPKAILWLNENGISNDMVDLNWINKSFETGFITLNFSSVNNEIVAKNNTIDFLSEADRKIIKPLISDKPITYKLQNQTWTRKP